jgi:hypothetical protein
VTGIESRSTAPNAGADAHSNAGILVSGSPERQKGDRLPSAFLPVTFSPTTIRGMSPMDEALIKEVSAAVHEGWMESKRTQGVETRRSENGEELMVPYAELSEPAKDLDRSLTGGHMKKLRLDLDMLRVDSFALEPMMASSTAGTVHGVQQQTDGYCSRACTGIEDTRCDTHNWHYTGCNQQTCGYTVPATCPASCEFTCNCMTSGCAELSRDCGGGGGGGGGTGAGDTGYCTDTSDYTCQATSA